jgi:hypothetical protein
MHSVLFTAIGIEKNSAVTAGEKRCCLFVLGGLQGVISGIERRLNCLAK